MSRKSRQKKPQQMFVNIGVEPDSVIKFSWSQSAQRFSYAVSKDGKVTRPAITIIGLTDERENGERRILAMSSSPLRPPILDFSEFLSTFTEVFFIDTAFKQKGDDQICATCVFHFRPQRPPSIWKFEPIELFGMEFWNPRSSDHSPCHPEKFAWRCLIQMIQKAEGYSESDSTALVVDPFRQDIPDYNKGYLPLLDDFYLPRNFELVYANSEVTEASMLNKLFSTADKLSKLLLQLALQGETDVCSLEILPVPGCSFFRLCEGTLKVLEEKQKQKQPRKK